MIKWWSQNCYLSASRFKRLHSLMILSWIARWTFTMCFPFRHSRTPVPQKGHSTMSLQTWCRGQDAGIQYPMKNSGFKYLSDILKQQQWKCSAVIKLLGHRDGSQGGIVAAKRGNCMWAIGTKIIKPLWQKPCLNVHLNRITVGMRKDLP